MTFWAFAVNHPGPIAPEDGKESFQLCGRACLWKRKGAILPQFSDLSFIMG